jgi:glycine/D-amino acid oxidase-like deaminating enzyme
MRIVVIGAGSVGAHVAFRLLEQGASVVLVDAARPGQGTTASSVAWLSEFPQMSWTEEAGRAALRRQVHGVFHDLQQEVPGDYVHWTGAVLWGNPHERAPYAEAAERVRAMGRAVQTIDAATARSIEPAIVLPDDEVVFFEPGSGWVDGPGIVSALTAEFTRRGGVMRSGARVVSVEQRGGRVSGVRLDDGTLLEADAFVNAAGSWATHLAAMADLAVPLDLVPGRMIYTEPFAPEQGPTRIVNAPDWCGRPDPSGGFAIHWRGAPQEPGHGANTRSAQEVITAASAVIPALAGTAPARTSVGVRPIPPGGPVIGAVPWLENFYFTVSHGGIGWGPTWGWMAARELLHGERVPELSAMRPERFYLEPIAIGRFADDAEQVPA